MTATPRQPMMDTWPTGIMTCFQVCPFQCSSTASLTPPAAQASSADDALTA